MSRNATISLVPLACGQPYSLEKRLEEMGAHVGQAATLKSDMVCFPEICNTLGAPDMWQFEQLDGPTLTAMSKVARKHHLYVVVPLGTMDGGKRRNSSVLIDRAGKIVGVYHKNVPTHPELDLGVIPGTETPVFETDFGRVGLCICFDLDYWEVGAGLCASKSELVIWSSMWTGVRMMARWSVEFGFYMAGVSGAGSFVDLAGRPICSRSNSMTGVAGAAPLVTETLALDRRLLHHDGNLGRLKPLYDKYGPAAAYAEWLGDECQLVFGSQLPGVSSDDLIEEFQLEPMRDYLARTRHDRKRALEGTYPVKK